MTCAAELFLTIAGDPEMAGSNLRNVLTAVTMFQWAWSRPVRQTLHHRRGSGPRWFAMKLGVATSRQHASTKAGT